MVVKNKKPFSVGILFALTFLAVLLAIFSPIFGGKNGLRFADDSFNRLSKGSSYFIPKVAKSVEKLDGKLFSAAIKIESAEEAALAAKLFSAAGATVLAEESALKVQGDLGAVLRSAVQDADSMFNNDGHAVSAKYGIEGKKALHTWWAALAKIEKNMKKEKQVEDAKVVSDVMKKAIEPGYNFYGIDGQRVKDHAVMMTGLLVFYVLYTMWWGYAIFYIFEGVGLSMKKAKVKKEA